MILVIGGSSFIGVYTVTELVKQGKKVIVTGRNNHFRDIYEAQDIEYIDFDLTDPTTYQALPTKDIESVILLAGLLPANATSDLKTEDNAADYIKVNTLGTAYLLEFCRLNKINRLISMTTYAEVAGFWEKGNALDETTPRNYYLNGDHAAYVVSKNAASDLMYYYNEQHNMKNIVFRLPPVYGVGPHGSLYINGVEQKSGLQLFIELAELGKPIEVHGDGSLERDVIYVKDVAKALYLANNSKIAKGLYNMTSGQSLTLKKQVEVIVDVFSKDKTSDIVFNLAKKNNTSSFLFDMSKAKKDFDFDPDYSDFRKMMMDYKKELLDGTYVNIFGLNKELNNDL